MSSIKPQTRGVDRRHELSGQISNRDIRSNGEKFKDWLLNDSGVLILGSMLVGMIFIYPLLAEVWFGLGLLLYWWTSKQPYALPFRIPITSELEDPSEGAYSPKERDARKKKKLPNHRYKSAAGITYFGNELSTNQELWFNDSDLRTHLLVFGSTGAGKTEVLISLAYNCLVQGSGFIYVDGKGDNSLFAKIFSICRSLGREDDLLVINYMTGGRDVFGAQKTRISNTLNPFIAGSAAGLTELIVSLMDESGGDGAMWKGRAISMISGIMFPLVYMRDNLGLLLDVDVLREYLILDNIQVLAKRRDIPAELLKAVRAYLRSLPGYQENAPQGKQSETVLDQHGFLQMQFTRIFGSLADTYGYIYRTNLGEVDFYDVVANRRILVVLLPALEKSPDELANLGKIIVSCLKQMMAVSLGDTLEGKYADVVDSKPTLTESPFMCILDEYGYYVVKGAAVMPAQARSLGFSMCFAGQDYPSFKKGNNAEEAIATIGNCNIKICMKIEDPTETFELFDKAAAEGLVGQTSGMARQTDDLVPQYMDQGNANVQRVRRLNLLDLRDQNPGEAHIMFKSTLVRAIMFYANPPKAKTLRLNYFLRVEPPQKREMLEQDEALKTMGKQLSNATLVNDHLQDDRLDGRLTLTLRYVEAMQAKNSLGNPGEVCASALGLVKYHLYQSQSANYQRIVQGAQAIQDSDYDEDNDRMSIFGDPDDDQNDNDLPQAPSRRAEQYYQQNMQQNRQEEDADENDPYLDRDQMMEKLRATEESFGTKPMEARQKAQITVDEIQRLSQYPSVRPEEKEVSSILDILHEIHDDLNEGDGR